MSKRPNHRIVKRNRTYTVKEIARLLQIHENTVLRWIKNSLPIVDQMRPFLIHGYELIHFLQERRNRTKHPLPAGQMFCFRCRTSKSPAGDMLQYEPVTEKIANATGLCPDCGCRMHRLTSIADLGDGPWKSQPTLPQALRHISEMNQRSVNSDFRGDV